MTSSSDNNNNKPKNNNPDGHHPDCPHHIGNTATVKQVLDTMPDVIQNQQTRAIILISVGDEGISIFNKGVHDHHVVSLLEEIVRHKSDIQDTGYVLDKVALSKLQ